MVKPNVMSDGRLEAGQREEILIGDRVGVRSYAATGDETELSVSYLKEALLSFRGCGQLQRNLFQASQIQPWTTPRLPHIGNFTQS
jgi:hypothetical protein